MRFNPTGIVSAPSLRVMDTTTHGSITFTAISFKAQHTDNVSYSKNKRLIQKKAIAMVKGCPHR
jgi:hypothetical protein